MDNLNLNKHISGQFNAELEHIRTQDDHGRYGRAAADRCNYRYA